MVNADLARLRTTTTKSISPENFTGEKGGAARATEGTGAEAARELGKGWKVSPSVLIKGGETFTLADIAESGLITHIWLTTANTMTRSLILRAHWDGAAEPAIEVPVADFFANGWGRFAQVSSELIATNPHGGYNSYWPMPFGRSAVLTLENQSPDDVIVYYQITYETGEAQSDRGYLHAQFRRSNPLTRGQTHPILTEVTGRGHYAGTYMAWGVNSTGWWGEGEIKFWLDGDAEYPSIAGTGTEDYFGGAWNFDVPGQGWTEYCTPYLGMPQVIAPNALYSSQQRFGLYRWHVRDPITFAKDITVDIQALGWQSRGRYLQLADDIASVAFFYLDQTSTNRPELPTPNELELGVNFTDL